MKTRELEDGEFLFSTDQSRLDMKTIHSFLSTSYWSPGIPVEVIQKANDHSICIGVYKGKQQIGFARLVSDESTFAYLADVFILEDFRGEGLSKKMMAFIFDFEFVSGLRRFILATLDAHGLYAQFGFEPLGKPDRYMEVIQPDIYRKQKTV